MANPPRSALHIAPEQILEQKLRPLIGKGYITADLMQAYVDVKMDITDINSPDAYFDFIYCSHVLEHVPDDLKAMREFRRVLADGGIAILLVPITAEKTIEDLSVQDPKERRRLFGQEDHVRKYGPDYVFRLENAGFNVEVLEPEDFLDAREIERMGITPAAGVIYVCRK
jgi:SAM-dependent methyltransferase